MQTIQTSTVPDAQLAALAQFADSADVGTELRDVLLSVRRCISDGVDLAVVDNAAILTPNQVAERLGMSRSHLDRSHLNLSLMMISAISWCIPERASRRP